MTRLSASVEVAAPAGTTWLALTDWERQGEWMLGTQVRVVEGDGRSVGTRLEAHTGWFGIGVTDPMEITVWTPPLRCTVRHRGVLIRGTGSFHVHADGASQCTVVWAENLNPPLGAIGRLGLALFGPAASLGLRQSLRRFARLVERGAR